jgi:hypothetical protein
MAQVVEHLLSKQEALNLNPGTTKKKRKKQTKQNPHRAPSH